MESKNYFIMMKTIVLIVTYGSIIFLKLTCCFWYIYFTYAM